MDEIIKKAIEGGFRNRGDFYESIGSKDPVQAEIDFALTDYEAPVWQEYVCNPLFWQALGKACGWTGRYCSGCWRVHDFRGDCDTGVNDEKWDAPTYMALRFHEINLAEGWDKAVEYLKNLTK